MKVTRSDGGDYIVTTSPEEAHVLIWGGPEDLYHALYGELRTKLVEVEDSQMTADEYQERFGNLDAVYKKLKADREEQT